MNYFLFFHILVGFFRFRHSAYLRVSLPGGWLPVIVARKSKIFSWMSLWKREKKFENNVGCWSGALVHSIYFLKTRARKSHDSVPLIQVLFVTKPRMELLVYLLGSWRGSCWSRERRWPARSSCWWRRRRSWTAWTAAWPSPTTSSRSRSGFFR